MVPSGATATQIGQDWIEITYGRPILRGRTNIFGAGADYGVKLNDSGPVWRAGANDTTLLRNGVALEIGGDKPERLDFDAVIATVPNQAFLRVVPNLPEEYAAKLRAVQYQWALCLVLALKRSLSPFYWMNMSDRSVPFLALVQHTNFIEPEQYGGLHVPICPTTWTRNRRC